MRKVCTGPFQFTPYRPWSDERRAAARERELARRALSSAPVRPLVALPKRPWQTPTLVEIGCIRAAARSADADVLWLEDEDDDFVLDEAATLCAIHLGIRCYEFQTPMKFSPGWYAILDEFKNHIAVAPMEGDGDDVVVARC